MNKQLTIEVLYVERLNNSRLGNPRWSLHTVSKSYITAPDISDSHMLYPTFTGRMNIEVNERGRVIRMTPVAPLEYDPTGARINRD